MFRNALRALFEGDPPPREEKPLSGPGDLERRLEVVEKALADLHTVKIEWLDYEDRFLKILGRLNKREKAVQTVQDAPGTTNVQQPMSTAGPSRVELERALRARKTAGGW